MLNVDDSFAVEQWARRIGEQVPDAIALVTAVAVVLLVLGVRAWRRRDVNSADGEEA